MKKHVKYTMWERIKQFFTGTADELFEGLDTLLTEIDSNQFTSITGLKTLEIHAKNETSTESGIEASSSLGLWPTPELKASLSARDSTTQSTERDQNYADILMREFSIKDYIARLKSLLDHISVKHLYIFVDDFSELPKDAMEIVVDTLLAPLKIGQMNSLSSKYLHIQEWFIMEILTRLRLMRLTLTCINFMVPPMLILWIKRLLNLLAG